MHRKTALGNGLRLVTQELPGTNSSTVLILAGAGSRYEKKEINGLAHFLEHMFFKGAKRYPDAKSVSAAIDAVGGDFNAFTGKEYAGYFVKVAAQHRQLAMDVLSDMVLYSKFDEAEIDKERRVIMEEYNMYQDTPMYQVGWDFERLLFGDQPLGWDQVGSKEFIARVKRDDFVEFKRKLYTPDNMVISVAGKIDHQEVLTEVENFFQIKEPNKACEFEKCRFLDKGEGVWLQQKKTEQGHLIMGFPAYSETHPDHFALKVLSVILGGNMSSRMFTEIREKKGLTYYINTTTDDYQDIGVISTHAGVDVSRLQEAIISIKEQYWIMRENGVTDKELKRAQDFIKGKIGLRLEDSEEYAHMLGKQELLHNEIKTTDEIMKEIDKVTVADIKRICEDLLRPDYLRLAVIGPFEDKEALEKVLR